MKRNVERNFLIYHTVSKRKSVQTLQLRNRAMNSGICDAKIHD